MPSNPSNASSVYVPAAGAVKVTLPWSTVVMLCTWEPVSGAYTSIRGVKLALVPVRNNRTALPAICGRLPWNPAAEARFVLHGSIAVILAILAEGFFEYNLGDSEVLTIFLAVLAFGYIALEAPEVAP